MQVLENLVIDWAVEKQIPLVPTNALKQLEKTQEELNELIAEASMYPNVDLEKIQLEMGDVLVTLAIQARIWNTDLETCMSKSYHKIKNRTGVTIEGKFVKD